jgi:DNA mismatch repair protein MutS
MAYTKYESASFDDLTPMLQNYVKIKREHPNALVLLRAGDFLETFFEDAAIMALDLDLVLTSKLAGEKVGRVPLAGIPTHALDRYLCDLMNLGRVVVVADKVDDLTRSGGLPEWKVLRTYGVIK